MPHQLLGQHEYQVADLKCPSTGIKLTQEMINDGHCDCPDDGFDEPGTAACSKGKFYCANAPLEPMYISSFKVNDGVCDCCDGSDEYLNNFGTPCPNTCSDFIKAARRAKYIQKAHYKKVTSPISIILLLRRWKLPRTWKSSQLRVNKN